MAAPKRLYPVQGGRWRKIGPVRRRQSVTLDASGNGSVHFTVWSAWNKWEIEYMVMSTNQAPTTTPYPTVTWYVGGVSAGQSEGATWTGNQDIARGLIILDAGDDLDVVYVGGVVGAIASVAIEGVNYLWR